MRRLVVSVAVAAAMAASGWIGHASSPSASASDLAQAVVVPVRVPRPVYPPIAVSVRVSGEVEVKVAVRPDGSVESATIVSSVPLLSQPALEAAEKSQFECRGCTEPATPYSLVFAFRFDDMPPVPADLQQQEIVSVTPSQARITIIAETPLISGIVFSSYLVRSPKCLWLSPCVSHWAGLDYYYFKVRSAKCLWLWECGYKRRGSAEHRPRNHAQRAVTDDATEIRQLDALRGRIRRMAAVRT